MLYVVRYKRTPHLQDHIASKHTKEKAYKCKLCDMSFRIAKYRAIHMQTYHGAIDDDVVKEVSSIATFNSSSA